MFKRTRRLATLGSTISYPTWYNFKCSNVSSYPLLARSAVDIQLSLEIGRSSSTCVISATGLRSLPTTLLALRLPYRGAARLDNPATLVFVAMSHRDLRCLTIDADIEPIDSMETMEVPLRSV